MLEVGFHSHPEKLLGRGGDGGGENQGGVIARDSRRHPIGAPCLQIVTGFHLIKKIGVGVARQVHRAVVQVAILEGRSRDGMQ